MFGVDFSEIVLIFLIALVVLGPAKLPQVAATIGRWVGRARTMARQFREQLEQEANTLKDATDMRSRPSPPPAAAPAPADPAPEPAAHTASAPAAETAAHTEAAAPAEDPAPMDSSVRFANPAPTDPAPPAPSAASETAPEHLNHPAPLPAEPHERGA
jgi:sec-independent protein translocase protein TatB